MPSALAQRNGIWKEYWFPAMAGAVLVVAGTLPYLFGYLHACPGKRFTGFVGRGVESSAGYFMFARQAQDGYNLFENKFNPELLPRKYFNLEWWAYGKLSRWTNLSLLTLFHIDRVLTVFLFVFSCYYLCGLAIDSVFGRRVALSLIVFGAGFGWGLWISSKTLGPHMAGASYDGLRGLLVHGAGLPISRDVAGVTIFGYLINKPHFIRACLCIVLAMAFLLAGERTRKTRYFALSGLCALLYTQIRPYGIPELCASYAVFPALVSLKERRFATRLFRNCALSALLLLPSIALYAYLAHGNVLGMKGWERVSGRFVEYIVWYGLPFVLLILDSPGLMRFRFMPKPTLLLLVWLLSAFLFAQSYPYFRSGEETAAWSFWIVSAVLATAGPLRRLWYRVVQPAAANVLSPTLAGSPRFRVAAAALLVAFCGLSNVIVYGRMFSGLSDCSRVYYMDEDYYAAFDWLDVHANKNEVVLASYSTSAFVPWFSGNKTVTGHDMITADFDEKNAAIQHFYADPGEADSKRRFLAHNAVRYVIVGPWEDFGTAGWQAIGASSLQEAFSSGDVSVYGCTTGPNRK